MSETQIKKVGTSLVQEQDLGIWEGDIAVLVPDLPSPSLHWKGAPIPWSIFRQALGFFRYAYKTWKSEAVLRLLYNQADEEWAVVCLPQTVRPGLEALELKTLDDTQTTQRAAAFEEHANFASCGTIHSHCMASAHQSGTDKAGEMKDPGVHITLGKIDDADVDCHGRVCFRGVQYLINWSEWLDGYDESWGLEGSNCLLTLGDAEDDTALAFPAEWISCCYTPPPLPKWSPRSWQPKKIGTSTSTYPNYNNIYNDDYEDDPDYDWNVGYMGNYGPRPTTYPTSSGAGNRYNTGYYGEFEFMAEEIANEIDSASTSQLLSYDTLVSLAENVLSAPVDHIAENKETLFLEDGSVDKGHNIYRRCLEIVVSVEDLAEAFDGTAIGTGLDPEVLLRALEETVL